MELGDKLKELRHEKHLLQKDVSAALDISVNCYGGYEQGYREPDLKTLIKLCKFYGVSSDYLLGLES